MDPLLDLSSSDLSVNTAMEEDTLSNPDTPGDFGEQSSYEKQTANLETYVNSLPYECDSIDAMQDKLEYIVGRIYMCATARNWLLLSTWDGALECWLLMKYPMQTATRAKLVRFYYELCLLPGVETNVIRNWTHMLSRLMANKSGRKRKLELSDLQLPWQPLWRVLVKELWPKDQLVEQSRNFLNILLYLAEQCKIYFPPAEIPEMLNTFIPLVTKNTILTMIPVFTTFLPPTHTHLYLPALLKLWQAFNSSIIDERMIELAGDLSQEHVSGPNGEAGPEGGATYKDVGIWSQEDWTFMISKGLGFMHVPIGTSKGASSTSRYADAIASTNSLKIKKTINRFQSLANIMIYSMSTDGTIRNTNTSHEDGFLAGSKALDSLERLITNTETFFHPSNAGPWSLTLTSFLDHLSVTFCQRTKEEEQPDCLTPITRRLTPAIRRAFVSLLSRPAYLAMFAKDSMTLGYANNTIRALAVLEPDIVMPDLLERAYGGLEVVNETHRTTAVLSMLLSISRPLVTESLWFGGQKHLLPLLELCIPGIDLNDPNKTVCTTTFIVGVVQHIKIGDLSMHQSGLPLTEDAPGDELMDVDGDVHMPGGVEAGMPSLNREEEKALIRESTAGFTEWITTLVRRILALYENLPEEGGRRNTTGGKQEEAVLKSIKSMMDVICLHLSDQLFDLVLRLVYDYATTNAKSNAVKAFGQLIGCFARVKPELTLAKFMPYCVPQIEDELKHGASSIRTTSSHAAVPSDTTLHWNISILRGCLGYGGPALLKYKSDIISLLLLLINTTKSERGYSSTGRLISRLLHTLSSVYTLNTRFVSDEEWESEAFDRDHNAYWGKLYSVEEVQIKWHVPSREEVNFILELLRTVYVPTLQKVEYLLTKTSSWDNADRNDFCRYLQACRSVWAGLLTFVLESPKEVINSCVDEDVETMELLVTPLDVSAGFTLTDPSDPRYAEAIKHRQHFGEVLKLAASTLRQNAGGEDHIDAVLAVARSMDVYLLDYAQGRSYLDALTKNYTSARNLNKTWNRQQENSRLVFVKRANVYHAGRVYLRSLYRRRSSLDDAILTELAELSLSQYTRVRRHSQSVLRNVFGYYIRSTRYTLPILFNALSKGNDPDRMKGALYLLSDKGISAYALADATYSSKYILSILECQHEEKPSIQQLVGSICSDSLSHLQEESVHTDAYQLDTSRIEGALQELEVEFSDKLVDRQLLSKVITKSVVRASKKNANYIAVTTAILGIASRHKTHWRYVQYSSRFLAALLRRDASISAPIANFFLTHCTSPQPTIRSTCQRAFTKILQFIKIRSFAKSAEELWLCEWTNPLRSTLSISSPSDFISVYENTIDGDRLPIYIDTLKTGFLSWNPIVNGFKAPEDGFSFSWEMSALPTLEATREIISNPKYLQQLLTLWSQETNKNGGNIELRGDNCLFIKNLARVFRIDSARIILEVIDPLLSDQDKFKQRAGGEVLAGLIRGSKHWPKSECDELWSWTIGRLAIIFSQIKPDTLQFWEYVFTYILEGRDPRRNKPLVNWILALPLEFNGNSVFEMNKSLSIFGIFIDSMGRRLNGRSDEYFKLALTNTDTIYAEIRTHVVRMLNSITLCQWQPAYDTTSSFIRACSEKSDPLSIRDPRYGQYVKDILVKLPTLRNQRLPAPRVNQSEYDKIGLSLLLWIWVTAHGANAPLIFSYSVLMMPEILRMTEIHDHQDLQSYSSAVLYVLSAVSPPANDVAIILGNFVSAIKSSTSWRLRLHALPTLVVFFYRNTFSMSLEAVSQVMEVLLDCLSDQNVEVRETAYKMLSGVVRCAQRRSIIPLKKQFVSLARRTVLPARRDAAYPDALRVLHSAILGLCSLMESFPYSVEPWMPSLTEVLAPHATDPPPISTTIRKCASEFKKTHQDTWHKDQLSFNEDQLQSLSSMLVGTSYYA